jgi:hypothetical protein
MYGQTVGTLNAATGIALLPDTGNSRTLFVIAASLLVSGVAIFVIATVLGRKSRQT